MIGFPPAAAARGSPLRLLVLVLLLSFFFAFPRRPRAVVDTRKIYDRRTGHEGSPLRSPLFWPGPQNESEQKRTGENRRTEKKRETRTERKGKREREREREREKDVDLSQPPERKRGSKGKRKKREMGGKRVVFCRPESDSWQSDRWWRHS